jgi:hypothetical protein
MGLRKGIRFLAAAASAARRFYGFHRLCRSGNFIPVGGSKSEHLYEGLIASRVSGIKRAFAVKRPVLIVEFRRQHFERCQAGDFEIR